MKKLLISAIIAAASIGATTASASSAWIEHGVKLNARSGPGTHYNVIGTFHACTQIHVVGWQHGWAKVSYNHNHYWVAGKYLQNHACTNHYKPKPKHNNYGNNY
ncbi:SH3 domain-containing protein [uncultured Pelagimonas sp.]|uniref:SH3 domain-containing protein n=1 Tax=uncultured Pelagimonas sp. TaxID=1618102 RepID=UPI00263538C0|nr:SH3 domain-containing protein [uncultured Pelagimonas sp.]